MVDYKFETEWDENSGIGWWDAGRKKLNEIIRLYNSWQMNGFSQAEANHILIQIEYANQTWANTDGGGGWQKKMEEMRKVVLDVLENKKSGLW